MSKNKGKSNNTNNSTKGKSTSIRNEKPSGGYSRPEMSDYAYTEGDF